MTYRVRVASPEHDRQAIGRLVDGNLSGGAAGRQVWFYDRAPVTPITCVSELTDSAQTVGSASLLPIEVKAGESMLRAGVAVDFSIDAAHRGFGPALKLQRLLLGAGAEAGLVAALAFPNGASELVLRRVGYQPIGSARGWVKVLRSRYALRQYVRSDALALPASFLVDGLFALGERIARRRAARHGLRGRILASADGRFDELWQRASGLAPYLVKRSAAFLNWRYLECPLWPFRLFAVEDGDGAHVLGYVVFHADQEKLVVDDYFYEDRPGVPEFLFHAFFVEARKTRARAMVLLSIENNRNRRLLRSLGFVPRDRARAVLGYPPQADLAPRWLDAEAWHLTEGDLDL